MGWGLGFTCTHLWPSVNTKFLSYQPSEQTALDWVGSPHAVTRSLSVSVSLSLFFCLAVSLLHFAMSLFICLCLCIVDHSVCLRQSLFVYVSYLCVAYLLSPCRYQPSSFLSQSFWLWLCTDSHSVCLRVSLLHFTISLPLHCRSFCLRPCFLSLCSLHFLTCHSVRLSFFVLSLFFWFCLCTVSASFSVSFFLSFCMYVCYHVRLRQSFCHCLCFSASVSCLTLSVSVSFPVSVFLSFCTVRVLSRPSPSIFLPLFVFLCLCVVSHFVCLCQSFLVCLYFSVFVLCFTLSVSANLCAVSNV